VSHLEERYELCLRLVVMRAAWDDAPQDEHPMAGPARDTKVCFEETDRLSDGEGWLRRFKAG